PGLVDCHAHIAVNGHNMGIDTDRFCRASGVTTMCDAGSAGSANFAGLRYVIDTAVRTRTKAFVNLSAIGIMAASRCGELSHQTYADPEGCARTIAENQDIAIGVKLRYGPNLVWEYSDAPFKVARQAADTAGVPLMVHITGTPLPLPRILEYMKPGDIITHCFHGGDHGIMGPEKQLLLKEVVEAQRNGVIFDCAHGRSGHFSFPLIEKALDQGFLPDTISSDLTFGGATRGPVFDLATTMSKLMHFGVSLDEVVLRATLRPAQILGMENEVGSLAPGARADVAVFELRDEPVELHDSDGHSVMAKRRLINHLTLRGGRVWYERPN
ncbi:MAG: amidohydrolase family protein, partial [Alphaproteobacteria bacterium]|nr:amidohydrolase family protein [Alphaproteobacteria bacterium]